MLAYRALLARAGFAVPPGMAARTRGLFRQELVDRLANLGADYATAAQIFGSQNPSWSQLALAFQHLDAYIVNEKNDYNVFEQWYMARPGSSGDPWADEDFKSLLAMFRYPNGPRLVGQARSQHSETTVQDYVKEIYDHLVAGRLVIVDQSSGEPDLNTSASERIVWGVFRGNQHEFRTGSMEIPEILLYVEEAHSLLPAGSETKLDDIWVRTAKEGAKYHIGLVYATQEVSSIQKNILKNTANWFIGHLNNTDETRDIGKFYDFGDFQSSILRAQDAGFLRVKTLSSKFVAPVQVRRFSVVV